MSDTKLSLEDMEKINQYLASHTDVLLHIFYTVFIRALMGIHEDMNTNDPEIIRENIANIRTLMENQKNFKQNLDEAVSHTLWELENSARKND